MTAAALIALATVAALAVFWATLTLIDRWLSRRLDAAWDADGGTPIYEATVKALRYRPGVGRT